MDEPIGDTVIGYRLHSLAGSPPKKALSLAKVCIYRGDAYLVADCMTVVGAADDRCLGAILRNVAAAVAGLENVKLVPEEDLPSIKASWHDQVPEPVARIAKISRDAAR